MERDEGILIAGAKEEKWYFNSEKSNSATSINDSLLSKEQPRKEVKNQYKYDPKTPIITIGGRNLFGELGYYLINDLPK